MGASSGPGCEPAASTASGVLAESHPSRLLDIAARIRSAASRDGKPRGDHMIACEEQIVRHFRQHWADDEDAQNIADVADTMAHCLRAEKAMVDGLTAVGLEAAEALEALAAGHNSRDNDGPRMAETAVQARGEAGPARAEGIAKRC
jgi:hypothetical protein